jgi:hypothetical protein
MTRKRATTAVVIVAIVALLAYALVPALHVPTFSERHALAFMRGLGSTAQMLAMIIVAFALVALVWGFFWLLEAPLRKRERAQRAATEAKEVVRRKMEDEDERDRAAMMRLGLPPDDPARAWMMQQPHLDVGIATGEFAKLQVGNAPAESEIVSLTLEQACRGVGVIGSMGAGKTSGTMNPFAQQAIQQGWGVLAFAVKNDVPGTLVRLAHEAGRLDDVILLAPEGPLPGVPDDFPRHRLNVVAGLTPQSAGEAIGDQLGEPQDPYWVDAPSGLATAWFNTLYGLGERAHNVDLPDETVKDEAGNTTTIPGRTLRLAYDLKALRSCINLDGNDLMAVVKYANAYNVERLADSPDPEKQKRSAALDASHTYWTDDYVASFLRSSKGADNLAGIRTTLLKHMQALTNVAEIRACFTSDSTFDFEAAVNAGKIIIVAVDDSKYENAVRMANAFIFRRFAALSQSRLGKKNVAPCLLWMDEFASFGTTRMASALSRARQALFIPLIGFQSISGLTLALKRKEATSAILGMIGSWILCDANDPETIGWAKEKLGTTLFVEFTESTNTGNQGASLAGAAAAMMTGGLMHGAASLITSRVAGQVSQGKTIAESKRDVHLGEARYTSTLGPLGNGFVRALVMVKSPTGGEIRDIVEMPQV